MYKPLHSSRKTTTMKGLILTLFIIITVKSFSFAQNELIFYIDSSHTHGFILLNKEQPFSAQEDVKYRIDSFNMATGQTWRLPTHNEMKVVYTKTYDKKLLRSRLFEDTYLLSEIVTDPTGKFLGYYECNLRGNFFTYSPPAYDFAGNFRRRKYILVRTF